MHNTQHLALRREADLARLHRQVDLCEQFAAFKVPDSNRAVEVRYCNALACGIHSNKRWNTSHLECRNHAAFLERPQLEACIDVTMMLDEQVLSISREHGGISRGSDGQRRHAVARRCVPDADAIPGCRDETTRALIYSNEVLVFVDGDNPNRLRKREIPDSRTIALRGSRDGIAARSVEPDVFGLNLGRFRNIQASLEIFHGTLRIELEIPAHELACHAQRFIAYADRPGTRQLLADEVL